MSIIGEVTLAMVTSGGSVEMVMPVRSWLFDMVFQEAVDLFSDVGTVAVAM